MDTRFTAGQIVRFANPTPEEAGLTYTVVEDRETRVLVTPNDPHFTSWAIKPTEAYFVTDLELVPHAS